MADLWTVEEVNEYCNLFQTWQKAMLDAGYKLEDFTITLEKKDYNNGNI